MEPAAASDRDRRALTDSELEDLEAEAEAEAEYHEEDEYEEEGVEQLTLEEYEAKKAAEKKSILPALPPERKAGEGVVMKGGQRDAHEDLEHVAKSSFKDEVSYSPALMAATMSWQAVATAHGPDPRTFHASCAVTLPGVRDVFIDYKAPALMVHGGRNEAQRTMNDTWWFSGNRWTRLHLLGAPPSCRQAHTLTFLPGTPTSPPRVYLVGGHVQNGRDSLIHVLTIKVDEQWEWGTLHRACSSRNVLQEKYYHAQDVAKDVEWCGCAEYSLHNPKSEFLRSHWSPMINKGSLPGLSSHTAVAMPAEMWIYGGKTGKDPNPQAYYVPAPIVCSLRSKNMNITVYTPTGQMLHGNITIEASRVQQVVVTQLKTRNWPPARYGHVAAYVQTKGMYIIGGANGQEEFDDIWLLPYGTGQWSRITYRGRLPTLVNSAVAVVDTLIYIFGGFSSGRALSNLFVFDTKTQSVLQLEVPGTPPAARGGHSMALLDDCIYIFGGSDDKGHIFDDVTRLTNVIDFSARASFVGKELLSMFESSFMTDFEVHTADGGIIKCHRMILAARCPFFRTKLVAEPGTTHMIFSDDEQTFCRFIRFLYSDTVRLAAPWAPAMRTLAQKLKMPQLEAICDSIQAPTIIPPSSLISDMQWLLESGELSDVELAAGGRVFKTHRALLAARSKFFKAMFTSNFKESQRGVRVSMTELEPELLQALLMFLYCETVDPQAHQIAFELLGQCELLELPDLRDRCVDILKTAISTENVSLLHSASEMFKAPLLTEATLRWVTQTALASGGLDEALIDALSERLLDQVNIERAKGTLPPLRKREAKNKKDELPTYSWNDTCKCGLPLAYSSGAWTGKLPRDLLSEALGGAQLKYEAVLSLTNQIGHRAKVTLPNGTTVAPLLPRNTRRDAEQLAALAALHVLHEWLSDCFPGFSVPHLKRRRGNPKQQTILYVLWSPPTLEQQAQLKKFLRHVPFDEEGYTQSFSPDQTDEFTEFLNEYGFVVIRCLSPEECAATVIDLFADMNAQAAASQKQMILPNEPSTWENENWPSPQNKFLILTPPQTQQAYNNRVHPNLYRAYRAIYGERMPLLTYVDHWGIMRGTKELAFRDGDSVAVRERGDWRYNLQPHWDLNPWKHIEYLNSGGYHLYQSLIALVDCPTEVGGFMTVPGCTNALSLWTTLVKPNAQQLAGHSYHPHEQDLLVGQLQKVPVRAGDLIIWNSMQLHTNFPNRSPRMRLVQYVRLNPAGYVKEKNHAPDPKKLAGLTFTPLGRLLVGLDAWKQDP